MKKQILSLQQDVEEALHQITEALSLAGLRVLRSFDLQSACAPLHTPCPHHVVAPCSCQLVVLLVYDWRSRPHSMTIHGYDGHCQIALIESPHYPDEDEFSETLLVALKAGLPVGLV